MSKKLLHPEQVRDWLVRRFNNQHRAWLVGGGEWPLRVPLGTPTENEFSEDVSSVRIWVDAWAGWRGAGALETEVRKWPRLGSQTLPTYVMLASALEVSQWIGQERRWGRACQRFDVMTQTWAQLRERAGLERHFDLLADYSDADIKRLMSALTWFLANPRSELYVRQLPIEGVDTKWIEKRFAVVVQLLGLLRGESAEVDFFTATGLRKLTHRIRMRVLCPLLRVRMGGLRDVEAPVEELAQLALSPAAVLILENQESGVALPDMAGVVAFLKLGNAVSSLGSIPWLKGVPAVYWGDIDSFGIAILSRARKVLPGVRSVLMDEQTLLRFKELTVQETTQHSDVELGELNPSERAIFDGLRAGLWGAKVRLEQERIPWAFALDALLAAIGEAVAEASDVGEETLGALVEGLEVPFRLSEADAKELRILDLERIFQAQLSVSEVRNEAELRQRLEDALFEVDTLLQEAESNKHPRWWRYADLRDDLIDVLRAVNERLCPS